jgi:4-amino-4-deoxy-L-arabinose transferase-like glycosyltransferase
MDTSRTIRGFRESGIDLLRPEVSWMGAWRVVVLECPLPQAAVAVAERALGTGSLRVARGVFYASYLLAAAAAFAFFRRSAGEGPARWATLALLASPLVQHYARALVVDLFAIGLGLAAFALAAGALARRSPAGLALAALVATPAALVKAPALLPLVPPLLLLALATRERRLLLAGALLSLLPATAFVLWRLHAETVNGAAPDWSFIPDWHRMTDMGRWYFGSLAQRLDPVAWKTLAARAAREAFGPAGAVLLLPGLLLLPHRDDGRAVFAWLAGTALYVLVFWNLNVVHDYYQLAALPALALLAAGPLHLLAERLAPRGPLSWLAPLALLGLVASAGAWWGDRHLYDVPPVSCAFGEAVRALTPAGVLVVAVKDDVDARCPLLLEPSRRDGWSVREQFLSPAIVERLRRLGATHLAWAHRGEPDPARLGEVAARPRRTLPLASGYALSLWELAPGGDAPGRGGQGLGAARK